MIRYYRLITEVDAAVGRLVDELKAENDENTLIVFMGDNGYLHGDRAWRTSGIRMSRRSGAARHP